MLNIDQSRMQQVVQDAFDKVSGSRRWETAIVKAMQQIEENPYMHYDQCRAYLNHQPCWHRAAARLVERYNETSH